MKNENLMSNGIMITCNKKGPIGSAFSGNVTHFDQKPSGSNANLHIWHESIETGQTLLNFIIEKTQVNMNHCVNPQ